MQSDETFFNIPTNAWKSVRLGYDLKSASIGDASSRTATRCLGPGATDGRGSDLAGCTPGLGWGDWGGVWEAAGAVETVSIWDMSVETRMRT